MNVTLHHGDCLEVMRGMADSSVDAVVTDPPYFLPAEHYKVRSEWARSLSDLSIIEHFISSVVSECRRVLKPNGAMVLFCDGQSYPVMYVKCYRVFDRLTDIVWDKGVIGMGRGVRRQHELMLCALPASFEWNGWARSVLHAAPVPSSKRAHPAEKPVALMEQLCSLITPPNGTVLDPFMGSGSTGVAAIQEGFGFVGIEREAEYMAIAEKRIEDAQNAARQMEFAS